MEKNIIFLAFVLLLAFGNTGPNYSADARMAAESTVPFNKDVDRPMNLSGNSVGKHFEVAMEDKYVKGNEEGSDANISFPPGFDTVNNLTDNVRVQCTRTYPFDQPPYLVDEIVEPGIRTTWFLYIIDPTRVYTGYQCTWTIENNNNQCIKRVAWADPDHQRDMPFKCIDCIWKVQDEGIYLFNLTFKFYVMVAPWYSC